MIVTVTKEHIERGHAKSLIHNSLHNPIAIALQELDGNEYVVVTQTRVHRRCEHEERPHPGFVPNTRCKKAFCGVTTLPEYARQWLLEFYAGRYAPPFQFTL